MEDKIQEKPKKKHSKKIALATALGAAFLVGSIYGNNLISPIYSIINSMLPKAPVITQSLEQKPGKTYAVLANTSGATQVDRFSEGNNNYAMLNLLSSYKVLKEKGINDKDIFLLMYNPTNIDVFKTKEYMSLLEKKALSGILPSKADTEKDGKSIIDGVATKSNLFYTIENSGSNSKDKLLIIMDNPSPTETPEAEKRIIRQINYGTKNSGIQFNKEYISYYDFVQSIEKSKCGEVVIIFNNGDAASFLDGIRDFLPIMSKRVLAIDSPEGYGLDKETFIMQLLNKNLSQSLAGKEYPIRNVLSDFKGAQVHYFEEDKEKSPLEYPQFNESIFQIIKN